MTWDRRSESSRGAIEAQSAETGILRDYIVWWQVKRWENIVYVELGLRCAARVSELTVDGGDGE